MIERKTYHFRIYYITDDHRIIREIARKFKTQVSVNYESRIDTDEVGAGLLKETEKRGFIRIRTIISNVKQ